MNKLNIVSMPGMGIELYVKEYARLGNKELFMFDARLYPKARGNNMLIEQIKKSCSNRSGIVIAILRLDRACFNLNGQFFSMLRLFVDDLGNRVDLYPAHLKNNLSIIDKTQYVTPLKEEVLSKYIELTRENYRKSGGNVSLLKSSINNESTELSEKICEELYQYLSPQEQKALTNIAKNKEVKSELSTALINLKNLGFIDDKNKISSSLMESYIKSRSDLKKVLPLKEKRLYDLLLHKKGEVVDKDDIICTVWGNSMIGEISDWTLNSLVYRLRHHPNFICTNYEITNWKKQGYQLT